MRCVGKRTTVDMLNFGQYDALAKEGIWFGESLRC